MTLPLRPAVLGALADWWPRVVDSLSYRWQQAQADPVGTLFWTLIWGCAFVATFLLIRMLFTGWGDRNVTEKTLALSLLVHLLVAMLSTTVMLARQPAAATETRTPLRRVVLPNTGSSETGGGATAGRPRWDANAAPELTDTERLAKPLTEATASPARNRPRPELVTNLPLAPSLPADDTPPNPQLEPTQTDRPTRSQIEAQIDHESTASSRREALAAPRRPTNPTANRTRSDELPRRERTRPTLGNSLSNDPGRSLVGRSSDEVAPAPRSAPQTESGGGPLPDNQPATPVAETGPGTPSRTSEPPRFGRTGSRSATTPDRSPLAEPRPERTPRSRSTPLMAGSTTGNTSVRPLGEPPEIAPTLAQPTNSRRGLGSELPPLYRLRDAASRDEQAERQGATVATERAVAAGLAWLAQVQRADGAWPTLESVLGEDPDKPRFTTTGNAAEEARLQAERSQSGQNAESGLTGLALLAYLGAGHTPDDPEYGDRGALGLQWLLRQQVRRAGPAKPAERSEDGFLGGRANRFGRMYCHGMATLALGEAFGMTGDPTLREPLERAVAYIVRMQYPDGSWRYSDWRGQEGATGDMSLFGWQVMALKSAQTAGIQLPNQTLEQALARAQEFLLDRQAEIRQRGESRHGGLASYRTGAGERVKPAMTAEALFCRQLLELPANSGATAEAVGYLTQRLPRLAEPDLYYWYYATLALFQEGGPAWDRWNAALQNALLDDQRTQGNLAGSWNPRRPWGDFGGRVYSTAMSTLCLEVYYRYLPLSRSISPASATDKAAAKPAAGPAAGPDAKSATQPDATGNPVRRRTPPNPAAPPTPVDVPAADAPTGDAPAVESPAVESPAAEEGRPQEPRPQP